MLVPPFRLAGLLLLVLLAGCTSEPPTSDLPQMEFAVDTTLLGATVADSLLGLRFRAPAGWQAASADEIEQLAAQLQATEAGLRLSPRHAFRDSASASALLVTTLAITSADTSYTARMDRYEESLQAALPSDSLQRATFMKGDLRVTQFFAQPRGMVNFLLVVPSAHEPFVQFNYSIPQPQYSQYVRTLESSIGSIGHLR